MQNELSEDSKPFNQALVNPFEIVEHTPTNTKKPLRQTSFRWVALLLINILILGDFMALEGPQPIETQIKSNLNISSELYSMLYSSWALPSILSPVFGGYLIDRLGARKTLVMFSIFVTIGQFVYSYGGFALSFPLMIVGRMIYALGTDPLHVVQIVLINKWFKGKELALAISLSGATFGVGRALNSSLVPILYEATNSLSAPMFFEAFLCLAGTFISFVMVKWDFEDEKLELALNPGSYLKNQHIETEKISMKDIKFFSHTVWLLILNFGLICGCLLSFNAFANDFYHNKYEFSNVEAGNIISINFVVMAVSAAMCGKLVDNYGYRASLLVISSLFGIGGFSYFFMVPVGFKPISSVIPQILFGLQLGISGAVLYPSLPLVLKERYLGTGFGLFFVAENILVLVLPSLAMLINEKSSSSEKDYFGMLVFFAVSSCLMVITAILLFFEDRKNGSTLDRTVVSTDNLKKAMMDADETMIHSVDDEETDLA